MVGDGVVVNFADGAFLAADTSGEIAEVVNGEGDVGGAGFADGFAVVPGFGLGEELEVVLHTLGDADEDVGAFGDAGFAPERCGGVGGIEGELDIACVAAGDQADGFAGDRADVLEVLAVDGRGPFAADEVFVAALKGRLKLSLRPDVGCS